MSSIISWPTLLTRRSTKQCSGVILRPPTFLENEKKTKNSIELITIFQLSVKIFELRYQRVSHGFLWRLWCSDNPIKLLRKRIFSSDLISGKAEADRRRFFNLVEQIPISSFCDVFLISFVNFPHNWFAVWGSTDTADPSTDRLSGEEFSGCCCCCCWSGSKLEFIRVLAQAAQKQFDDLDDKNRQTDKLGLLTWGMETICKRKPWIQLARQL